MADTFLNVKIFKHNLTLLKDVKEPIKLALDNNNWSNYIKSLKIIQKSVNDFLSELVEAEKEIGGGISVENELSDEESEDDENNLAISPCKKKKIK